MQHVSTVSASSSASKQIILLKSQVQSHLVSQLRKLLLPLSVPLKSVCTYSFNSLLSKPFSD